MEEKIYELLSEEFPEIARSQTHWWTTEFSIP